MCAVARGDVDEFARLMDGQPTLPSHGRTESHHHHSYIARAVK